MRGLEQGAKALGGQSAWWIRLGVFNTQDMMDISDNGSGGVILVLIQHEPRKWNYRLVGSLFLNLFVW